MKGIKQAQREKPVRAGEGTKWTITKLSGWMTHLPAAMM